MQRRNIILLPVLLVLLLATSRIASAQDYTTIKAFVYDSLSQAPVPYASVIIKGTLAGSVTDENGYFEISAQSPDAALIITSLGHITREIKVKEINNNRIILRSRATELQEVVISAEKIKAFQENNGYYFIDFDFYDDNILALTAIGNKKYLQLMDLGGKAITMMRVNGKAEDLFKDCIGNIHVLTSDSSYQVYYDYVKLQLLSSYSIDKFRQSLAPCICSSKGVYYFREYKYRGLKCDYFCVTEKEPGKIYPFRFVADSARIQDFNAQYDLHYFLEVRRITHGGMYGEPIATLKKNMDKYREELEMDWLGSQWLQPVESELHRIGNSVYLFNFTDSVIEKYYDHDSLAGIVPFTLHRNKYSVHSVITDEVLGAAYLPSEKNSIITLHQVDPATGKEERAYEIKNYPFPSGLKVRNGIVYFLYRDKGTDKAMKIHRMVLQ